jgi:hypothetical protein
MQIISYHMSIQLYESAADREREHRVAQLIAMRWNCTPIKSGLLAMHDYALCRHDHKSNRLLAHAYLEIKCRSLHRPNYWLSKDKWDYLLELADTTSCPAFLAVHCATSDQVSFIQVQAPYPELITAGRSDRPDDPKAIEPMVILPAHRFRPLGKLRSSFDGQA